MNGRRRFASACFAAAALLLAGCGSSGGGGPAATSSPTSTDIAKVDGCAAPAGAKTDTWTVDSQLIQAVVVPAADAAVEKTVVVASNSSGANVCSWVPYAGLLSKAGTVWLHDYNLAGTGVEDVRAVVARAMKAGATRVVLVGSSQGAKASLVAGAQLPASQVAAVVALSPEAALEDGTPVLPKIRGKTFPTLIVTADHDPYQATSACHAFAAARPKVTTLKVIAGTAHGTEMLGGAEKDSLTALMAAFLAKHR